VLPPAASQGMVGEQGAQNRRTDAGEARSQPSRLVVHVCAAQPTVRGPFGAFTLRRAGATKSLWRLRGRRLRDEPPLGARLAAQKERIFRAGAHHHVGARAAPTGRDVEPVHATIVGALRPPVLPGFHTRRIGRSWGNRAGW
jgi:hypothetical protein